jgi:hypothetical protein
MKNKTVLVTGATGRPLISLILITLKALFYAIPGASCMIKENVKRH